MRRLFPAAIAAVFLLAACSSAAPESGASSSSDGKLVVYSGRSEELVGPLLEQAKTELGLDIEVRYGSTAEMAAQLLEEGDKTPADLFLSQDAGALGSLSEANLLTSLPQETLNKVDPTYRASNGHWIAVTGRARAFVVPVGTEDSAPKSVFDLTDPTWKGQVGIAPTNASFQSFITAMRVLKGEDAAEKWLTDMQANDVQIFKGNDQIVEAVADGKIKIGLVNHYYLFEVAQETGTTPNASLAYTGEGDPGSLVNISGVGITPKGYSDPDALTLVNYLLSQSAQKYFADKTNEYPMTTDAPAQPQGVPPLSSFKPIISLEKLSDLRGTLDLLAKVGLV